jgi:hypothetical protein
MGKPLPLTLLRVINPCHLHDVRKMTQPDDTTITLSKHGDSLCYIPPCLSVDDLVEQGQYRSKSDPARAAPSRRDMSFFSADPLDTSGCQRLPFTSWEGGFGVCDDGHQVGGQAISGRVGGRGERSQRFAPLPSAFRADGVRVAG